MAIMKSRGMDLENPDAASGIDKRAVRRAFDRVAQGYLQQATVQSEIGRRILSRLDLVRLQPGVVLDAGAGPGALASALALRYAQAKVIALDLSWQMLRRLPRPGSWLRWLGAGAGPQPQAVCGDFERLALRDASVDLVVSNLALNWSADLAGALRELHRVLKPGGLVMFTTLGPDTLKEWRGGAPAALAVRLADMHDIGDLLVHAGFSGPVMDQEQLTLTYSTATAFLQDLRCWGGLDCTTQRPRGLRGRGRAVNAVPAVTLEVVYGHAWKSPAAVRSDRLPDGRSVIQFDRLLHKTR